MRRFVPAVVLQLFLAGCATSTQTDPAPQLPSNTPPSPATTAASAETLDIDPGPLDRAEMCERAMDRTIAMLQLTDQNEIQQTGAAGVRDCLASNATRQDLACIIEANTLGDVAVCQDRAH